MESDKEEVLKNRLKQNVALQDDDKQGDENFHSPDQTKDQIIFIESDNKTNTKHTKGIDHLIRYDNGACDHRHHDHCLDDDQSHGHHHEQEENILDCDDDYVSDGNSTTSTSTSRLSSASATSSSSSTNDDSSSTANQQPDSTRVCDCCYCEVFGHGGPQVTPTSRNYREMRDRLRMRLSKRQAERCQKRESGQLSLDESSTDRGGGEFSCEGESLNHSPGNKSSASANQNNKASNLVVDQRNLDELLNYINGTNSGQRSNSRRKDKNIKGANKKCSTGGDKTGSYNTPGKASNSKTSSSNYSRTQNVRDERFYSPDCKVNQQRNTSKSASKIHPQQPSGLTEHKVRNQQRSATKQQSSKSSARNQPISKSLEQPSHQKHEAAEGAKSHREREKVRKRELEYSFELGGDCLSFENSAPDDVFMPRSDIDLEDVRLDELERELEAFKRFCFESVPLVKKERMQIQLKSNWIMP